MKIDPKTTSDIKYFIQRIESRTFDQDTLKSLIIAIRENASKRSFTREIGDFVAHPLRDKGLMLEHLSIFRIDQSKKGIIDFHIPVATSANALTGDLTRLLNSMNFNFQPSPEIHEELIVCYFGLLHMSRVQLAKKYEFRLFISPDFMKTKEGEKLLCIAAESTNKTRLPVFKSDIRLSKYIDDIDAINFQEHAPIRAIRIGETLKLV